MSQRGSRGHVPVNDPGDWVVGLAVLVDRLDRGGPVGLRLRDGRAAVVFDELVTDGAATRDVEDTVPSSMLTIERNLKVLVSPERSGDLRRSSDRRGGVPGRLPGSLPPLQPLSWEPEMTPMARISLGRAHWMDVSAMGYVGELALSIGRSRELGEDRGMCRDKEKGVITAMAKLIAPP